MIQAWSRPSPPPGIPVQVIYFQRLTRLREIIRSFHPVCKDFSDAFRASCAWLIAEGRLRRRPSGQVGAGAMAKRTKITIEADSLLVLRGRSSLRAWCPQCAAEGEMISLDGVGVISNLLPAEVEAWLESEAIHRLQAADRSPLICLNSLLKRVAKTA